jgi:hypothetical protein
VAKYEEERHRPQPPQRGIGGRIVARFVRLIAESLAEQRRLWHLRRETAVTVVHPADLKAPDVARLVRALIRKDYEKHRFWLVVDVLLLVASAVLMVLPGPNLIAYYFAFRVAGHFLSIRGARQGLTRVDWSPESSDELADLRALVAEDPQARRPRLDAIAAALGLEHLPRFFERVTASGA